MTVDKNKLVDFVSHNLSELKLLVIGDVMLDKYYYGEVTRISPEAPVPITRVTQTKDTMGGASNVAHNLALLGCHTSIAGYVGDDYHCQALMDKFTSRGIDYRGIIHYDKPTITKLRVIGGHQQMLRLDFEDVEPIARVYEERMLNYTSQVIESGLFDAVIISDYGKGACSERVCRSIIEECHMAGIKVFVDPKGWDWEKYAEADYLTPNLKEINAILEKPIKNRDQQVEIASRNIMERFSIANVLATRSECGLSIVGKDDVSHIPTKAQEVFDVSGAGDTVLATFAAGIVGGLTNLEAAYLANLAASVVVAKVGTYAVSREELLGALREAMSE